MHGKKADFNFVLIFAIVAGATILLIAVYGAMKFGKGASEKSDAELAKVMNIITDELQAGFAEGSVGSITYSKISRINNRCDSSYEFGENIISFQSKSSIGKKWSEESVESVIHNKYIFSENEESKKFYIYSKPFYTGYKVADLMFVLSGKYCFLNPPESIEQEILNSELVNIGIKSSRNNTCKEDYKKVCFNAFGCDIIVNGNCKDASCETEYDFGTVIGEDGLIKYYSNNLLFGAIISDKETYDCNVKRLLYRSSKVSDLLSRKIELSSSGACGDALRGELRAFSETLSKSTPKDLEYIQMTSNQLESINSRLGECVVW